MATSEPNAVTQFQDVASSRFEDVPTSRFEDVEPQDAPVRSLLGRGLDVLSMPGDYTRGLLAGKPGTRMTSGEFVDQASEGGIKQVLRERGPLAATIRDTAASLIDPLVLAGPLAGSARRLTGALRTTPKPSLPSQAPPSTTPPQLLPEAAPVPPVAPLSGGDISKYAGSVNLERLQTPDDVKRMILQASDQVPQSASLRFDDVIQAAQDLGGMSLEEATAFAKSGKADIVPMLRARQVHVALAEEAKTAQQAYFSAPSQETLRAYQTAWDKELTAFGAAQTIARRSGQALASLKIQAQPATADQARTTVNRAILELKNNGSFAPDVERRMMDINFDDPASVQQFIRYAGTKTASWRSKLFEGWMAAILSMPITHTVNSLSNTLFLGIRPLERLGSATAELRHGAARERLFGEAVADSFGMVAGLKDAMRTFWHTMKTEVPLGGVSKLEGSAKAPAIEGTKGQVIRTPLTLLTATDDFFKTLAIRGDLYAQAYRQAAKESVTLMERPAYIARLVAQPTESMLAHARSDAAYRTFQNELGAAGKTVLQLRKDLPGSEYIVPFIQTPLNIAKAAIERTPLNLARVMVKAGHGTLTGADLSDEAARAVMGSMTGAYIAALAAEGAVTGGGPRDQEQKAALRATGWQPYSIKIGQKYYSYQRLEPVGTVLAMAADFTETRELMSDQEAKGVAGKIVGSLVKNFGDKTFLVGIQGIVNVISDPDRYADNWIEKMAGSAVAPAIPSAVASYARADDPHYREVAGALEAIQAKIPGKMGVQGLPPRRDYFGEPLEKPGNFWTRFLSPVQVSTERGDPVRDLIRQLKIEVAPLKRMVHLPIPKANASGEITSLAGRSVELTPDEYDRLQVMAGGLAKTMVTGLVRNPGFSTMASVIQKDQIRRAFTQARELALKQMHVELMQRELRGAAKPLHLPRPRPTDLPRRPGAVITGVP